MLYDRLVRAGLVAQWPGIAAGHVVDEPVSTLDLGVTFDDWADIDHAPITDGQSLAALMEGGNETRVCSRTEWDVGTNQVGVAPNLSCVRTKTHKPTIDEIS